jgi:hypothetical protein
MKRFGSLRNAAAVLVFCGLVAAALAVASAQAAPSKKNFTVQVAVTKPVSGPVDAQNFTITLANDGSSNTTLGSANILPPAGFTVDTASTVQSGWTATPTLAGDLVALRSAAPSDALAPGRSMTVSVHIASPTLPTTCSSATWSAFVKQSNDFNGTNNSFTQLLAKSDMTPLGSYAWDQIGTTVNGVFAPAIYTTKAAGPPPAPGYPSPSPTVHALDTCGVAKARYAGPTTLAYSGHMATVSGPSSWSASGVGAVSITPTIAETNRVLTLTDSLTGISGPSDSFDTQDKICTSTDTSCAWANGNSSITASAHAPSQGSLGVGFNPVVPLFTCDGGNVPLGNTAITIAPHGTSANPGDLVYQVTLVYSKQVSGTGSASAFVFCESTTDGATWTLLPSCSAPAGTTVDCVFDQKRVTGGALQVILSLVGDPYVGGR